MAIFEETPGVVDVDWYVEEDQPRFRLEVDREQAALHGISVAQINQALDVALVGGQLGLLHQPLEKEDVPILLRLPLAERPGSRAWKGSGWRRPRAAWCRSRPWCDRARPRWIPASTTRT